MEAAVARENRWMRFHAAMTANQINCWIKHPVTVEKLLGQDAQGRPRSKQAKRLSEMNEQEKEEMVAALAKGAGRRKKRGK